MLVTEIWKLVMQGGRRTGLTIKGYHSLRAKKIHTSKDKLFPVEVLEAENNRVKVHYIGYGEEYDE